MARIKLDQFGGALPAWDAHLLPTGQAAYARDGYFFSGGLIGWRVPKLLRTLNDSAAKFVYRVPRNNQAVANATLTFLSNPQSNDTVTIGDLTYKFRAALLDPYDVLIGATAADSATNLFAALTLDNGELNADETAPLNSTVLYGVRTGSNEWVDQRTGKCKLDILAASPTIYVQAPDFGDAYNTTSVAESTSGVRLSWDASTLSGGSSSLFDTSLTAADATWLEFTDRNTTVMRSPVVDDQFSRYYFSSPSLPPKYNTSDRIAAGLDPWLLGVPAPNVAPTVGAFAGGNSDTLGLNSVTTTHATTGCTANTMFLIPVTYGGASQILDISYQPQTTSTTALTVAVVYDDKNGAPGNLLGIGSELTGFTAGQKSTSVFASPIGLLQGEQYWIGFATDTALNLYEADTDASAGGVYAANTYSSGPPSAAPAMTAGLPDYSIWATLQSDTIQENRAYLYTYVTEYNEEGPASASTLQLGWSNSEWSIGMAVPPETERGVTRNITKKRIYRTVSSTNGTSFFLVDEVSATQETYVDVIEDNVVATHLGLSTSSFFPPPAGLQGIVSMPNGMAVGFKGNELWFCEPYLPHAWPAQYVITTEFPIVGIGVTGQSVVVCTSGTPYVAVGVNPATMTLTKILLPEPCLSGAAIVSTDSAVYYASPNGLVQVTQAGDATNTTELWVTRDKWQELTPQKNLAAIKLASGYFAFGTVVDGDASVAQDGFVIEISPDSASFTIWPQPGGHRIGFTNLTSPSDYDIDNVLLDPWTGIGLLIQNGGIYYYDFSDTTPDVVPCLWRSKVYHLTAAQSFSAMKVYFTVPASTPAQNATRNTAAADDASWVTLDAGQYGIVRVYGDGELICCREIRTSGEVLRIPSDSKYEEWQFEIETRVLVSNMQVATSIKELSGV